MTYTAIPSGAELGDQPEQIAASVQVATIDDELRERICATSPHVELIRSRVRTMIEKEYSVYDEIKLIRTAPSPEFDVYNEHTELCRQWGREQREALGLL